MKKWAKVLGTIAAVTLPVTAVVSCGKNYIVYAGGSSESLSGYSKPFFNKYTKKITLNQKGDFSSLKADLQAIGITEQKLNQITVKDIQNYNLVHFSNIDSSKLDILNKVNSTLLKWTFDHNNDKPEMEALNSYFNNSGINTYASQSNGRQPSKSDTSKGKAYYYRSDLVDLVHVADFNNSVDLLDSRIKDQNTLKDYVTYNVRPNPNKGIRLVDNTSSSGATFNNFDNAAASFSLYRAHTVGKDVSEIDPKTGDVVFTSSKQHSNVLYDGLDLVLQSNGTDIPVSGRALTDLGNTFKNNPNADTMIFKNNSKVVNYAKAIGGNVVKSTVFRAKDLFYGLVRSLYTTSEVWKDGVLNGKDVSSVLPKYTAAEVTKFLNLFDGKTASDKEKSADAAKNPNFYLFDLFGIDIIKTINANKNNNDDGQFILKFNSGIKESTIGFFKNNSMITPFPKARLKDPTQPNKIDGENLGTYGDYGHPYSGSGDSNVDDVDVISPYVYTQATYGGGGQDGLIQVKKNPYYVDQNWVKNPNTFSSGMIRSLSKTTDTVAKTQAAYNRFTNATKTGEYSLDSFVEQNTEYLSKLSKYRNLEKINEIGPTNGSKLYWNLYSFKDSAYNDLGRKIMFGESDIDKIDNSNTASYNYFVGNGAILRDSVHAAVNWQALIETINPGQNKLFYPSIVQPGDFTISKLDPSDAYPDFLDGILTSMGIYKTNIGDKIRSWTSNKVMNAAKTLDELANSVGATADNPAYIPMFIYSFTGEAKGTSVWLDTNKQILGRLNSLTPKIQFRNPTTISWDDFVTQALTTKTHTTIMAGFGPDYSGLGSMMYQMLKSTGQIIDIAKVAFING